MESNENVMGTPGLMTIDMFNKLMGHETLHPLVCMADLSKAELEEDICMTCDFYGLLYYDNSWNREWLRLIHPGQLVEIPSKRHHPSEIYSGVLFHPDLLCDTPLESRIGIYPSHCRCQTALSGHEQRIITDNLREIEEELRYGIDRHSAGIIASHIELLLNYCTRFCFLYGTCGGIGASVDCLENNLKKS